MLGTKKEGAVYLLGTYFEVARQASYAIKKLALSPPPHTWLEAEVRRLRIPVRVDDVPQGEHSPHGRAVLDRHALRLPAKPKPKAKVKPKGESKAKVKQNKCEECGDSQDFLFIYVFDLFVQVETRR